MAEAQFPLGSLSLSLDRLVVKPPTINNSTRSFDPKIITEDANSTHIVVHSRWPALAIAFLAHKRNHGSQYEKALYIANFDWKDLATRLYEKRPLTSRQHHTAQRC